MRDDVTANAKSIESLDRSVGTLLTEIRGRVDDLAERTDELSTDANTAITAVQNLALQTMARMDTLTKRIDQVSADLTEAERDLTTVENVREQHHEEAEKARKTLRDDLNRTPAWVQRIIDSHESREMQRIDNLFARMDHFEKRILDLEAKKDDAGRPDPQKFKPTDWDRLAKEGRLFDALGIADADALVEHLEDIAYGAELACWTELARTISEAAILVRYKATGDW